MCGDHFCADNPANHAFGIVPNSATTQLLPIPATTNEYKRIQRDLMNSWLHPDRPQPTNLALLKVVWSGSRLLSFLDYRKRIAEVADLASEDERMFIRCNERYLYHGTHLSCGLLEADSTLTPCTLPSCALCSILRSSFETTRCGTNNPSMFGKGVYVAECGSKADRYCRNIRNPNGRRVLLLNRVVLGKTYETQVNRTDLQAPPDGYHSVHGVAGVELRYDEVVIYNNDAIRPAYLIVYDYDPQRVGNAKPTPAGVRAAMASLTGTTPTAKKTTRKGARRKAPNLRDLPYLTSPPQAQAEPTLKQPWRLALGDMLTGAKQTQQQQGVTLNFDGSQKKMGLARQRQIRKLPDRGRGLDDDLPQMAGPSNPTPTYRDRPVVDDRDARLSDEDSDVDSADGGFGNSPAPSHPTNPFVAFTAPPIASADTPGLITVSASQPPAYDYPLTSPPEPVEALTPPIPQPNRDDSLPFLLQSFTALQVRPQYSQSSQDIPPPEILIAQPIEARQFEPSNESFISAEEEEPREVPKLKPISFFSRMKRFSAAGDYAE